MEGEHAPAGDLRSQWWSATGSDGERPAPPEAPDVRPPTPAVPTLAARLRITPGLIRTVLGCLWILDAALQFQPAMFGRGLVAGMILPAAHGQPQPIAWSITTLGHFVLPDVGVWNFLVATLQLGIGVGLLFPRTARAALTVMFPWCLGVWWFGEGFGILLTGRASPLTGAPGAVLLYAALGLLVWPSTRRTPADDDRQFGVASSAAAHGPLGVRAALGAWSGFWLLSAVLWLLPANRAAGSAATQIAGMAAGQPHWYSSFLLSTAHHLGSAGGQLAWVMALLAVTVALGPLLSSRPGGFLALGSALALAMWVTGMGLGNVMTGMGTDPQTGPVVLLLAVSLAPWRVPVRATAGTPLSALLAWNRSATWGMASAAGAALLLSATYPVAGLGAQAARTGGSTVQVAASSLRVSPASSRAGASGSSGMAGMAGMGSSGGAYSARSTGGARGTGGKGMSASGMAGMAGLGVETPHWRYDGPPLPKAETQLLSTVTAETDHGHKMQTPDCTAPPTATQVLGAVQYVQETTAAVAKYRDLSTAVAAGYVPITDTAYPVVHYVNIGYLQQKYVMDPNHVQSLVYAFTPYGPVLVAAMYLMPSASEHGPMPYGCLVQWHAHTNLCMSSSTHQFVGFAPCTAGTFNYVTPVMTHVWQVPVPGGPLALDPSDLQVVQAAIQAQLDGQAPVTPGQGKVIGAGSAPAPGTL
ncbi:MAG: hypothetical protein ACYCU7_16400 [Acidimicrobiales bacterium]